MTMTLDPAEVAFSAYAAAARRAQTTLSLADGLAAGHAWRSFLETFEGRCSAAIIDLQTVRQLRGSGRSARS